MSLGFVPVLMREIISPFPLSISPRMGRDKPLWLACHSALHSPLINFPNFFISYVFQFLSANPSNHLASPAWLLAPHVCALLSLHSNLCGPVIFVAAQTKQLIVFICKRFWWLGPLKKSIKSRCWAVIAASDWRRIMHVFIFIISFLCLPTCCWVCS